MYMYILFAIHSQVATYVTTFATVGYTVLYAEYKDAPSGREHCFADIQRRHRKWMDRTIYGIVTDETTTTTAATTTTATTTSKTTDDDNESSKQSRRGIAEVAAKKS
jgi:hypothetical protein